MVVFLFNYTINNSTCCITLLASVPNGYDTTSPWNHNRTRKDRLELTSLCATGRPETLTVGFNAVESYFWSLLHLKHPCNFLIGSSFCTLQSFTNSNLFNPHLNKMPPCRKIKTLAWTFFHCSLSEMFPSLSQESFLNSFLCVPSADTELHKEQQSTASEL